MSINPAIQLSNTLAEIDQLQLGIVDLERRMDAATLAESSEDISALRLTLSKLKASLGEARNQESFWRQELAENKEARKAQGDIARA